MADNLEFHINTEEVAAQFGELKNQVQNALNDGVKGIAAATHAKVAQLAQENLKSTRDKYLEALQGFQEVAPGVWVVSLNESALWIEEGLEAHDMHDKMLKKNYKISKDGYKYRSIPFEHSKASDAQTGLEQNLVNQIRGHLKKQNIPFRGIERDASGKPRLGRVHTMNIPGPKMKKTHTAPPLKGLSIYQSKGPGGKVRRDILTFRTISEKNKGTGKWFHPGVQPKHFMDKALEWAMRTWESEILPGILSRF